MDGDGLFVLAIFAVLVFGTLLALPLPKIKERNINPPTTINFLLIKINYILGIKNGTWTSKYMMTYGK